MKFNKILLLFAIGLLSVSCIGPRGPVGPPGPSGGVNRLVWDFKAGLNTSRWIPDGSSEQPKYYFCTFDFPELTRDLYDNATVVAYYDTGNFQQVLPSTRFFENTSGRHWGETIDFTFAPGEISFFVTNSDFIYEREPAPMTFRVVVFW